MMLRTHTQTGGSTLTAQQPENNIVRAAIQALAAALGGVQSMALSCYDEALAIPTEQAQTIAVRTQQILAEEIGVTDTIDPLGGSYYVESLTDELERRASRRWTRSSRWAAPWRRSSRASTSKAILDEAYKWEQASIDGRARGRRRQQVPRRRRAASRSTSRSTRRWPSQQREKLERLRASATARGRGRRWRALRAAAEGEENLMPAIIDAVRADCTLGEICGAMREVFGEYKALAAI